MLVLHSNRGSRGQVPTDLAAGALPPEIVWIDLLKPEAGEIAFVERTAGLSVPSVEELSEIVRAIRGRNCLSDL